MLSNRRTNPELPNLFVFFTKCIWYWVNNENLPKFQLCNRVQVRIWYDTLNQDKTYCILNIQYWLLFHICNANSTVSKVSQTAGGSFGGTCDGVLYDVDISIEHTKEIFFGLHFP